MIQVREQGLHIWRTLKFYCDSKGVLSAYPLDVLPPVSCPRGIQLHQLQLKQEKPDVSCPPIAEALKPSKARRVIYLHDPGLYCLSVISDAFRCPDPSVILNVQAKSNLLPLVIPTESYIDRLQLLKHARPVVVVDTGKYENFPVQYTPFSPETDYMEVMEWVDYALWEWLSS